jgi:hypothetical protein
MIVVLSGPKTVSEVMGVQIGPDFESMAKYWLRNKKIQTTQYLYHCYLMEYLEN